MKIGYLLGLIALVLAITTQPAIVSDHASVTHQIYFIQTSDQVTMQWCVDENWRCEETEARGWEYGRARYFDFEDLDGDPGNYEFLFKFPKAGLWRVEIRSKQYGEWGSWRPGSAPRTTTSPNCPEPNEHGWLCYVFLGQITGGGFE